MAHDIFICHAHADFTIASAACAKLEDAGVRCWIAPRDVDAGPYARQLVHAITSASAVLLVFSDQTNKSEHILRELEIASKHQKVIIPFRIEDVPPNEDLEYFTLRVHWLDALSPPMGNRLGELVAFVKRLLAVKPALTDPEVAATTSDPVMHDTTPAPDRDEDDDLEAGGAQAKTPQVVTVQWRVPWPLPWRTTGARVAGGAVATAVVVIAIAFATRPPHRVPFPIRTFVPISAATVGAIPAMGRGGLSCPMDGAVMADDFVHGVSQWSKLPSDVEIARGILSMRPSSGHFSTAFHDGKFPADAIICTKAGAYGPNMPPTSVNTTAGIIFWDHTTPTTGDDYYIFQVNYRGNFTALHRSNGTWTLLRGPTFSNAIHMQAGIYNVLAVRTTGHTASLYVNGTQVDTVAGMPPAGGWWGGVIAGNGQDERPDVGWSFGAYGAMPTSEPH